MDYRPTDPDYLRIQQYMEASHGILFRPQIQSILRIIPNVPTFQDDNVPTF